MEHGVEPPSESEGGGRQSRRESGPEQHMGWNVVGWASWGAAGFIKSTDQTTFKAALDDAKSGAEGHSREEALAGRQGRAEAVELLNLE